MDNPSKPKHVVRLICEHLAGVRDLESGSCSQSMGVKLLTWTGDVVERLKEHFEELLKSTNTHSMEKAKDSEQASLIIPGRG